MRPAEVKERLGVSVLSRRRHLAQLFQFTELTPHPGKFGADSRFKPSPRTTSRHSQRQGTATSNTDANRAPPLAPANGKNKFIQSQGVEHESILMPTVATNSLVRPAEQGYQLRNATAAR
jgi:hypothetical protein